jgi:hypothetical protein
MNSRLSQFSPQMSQLCPSSCPSLSPLFSTFVPVSQLFSRIREEGWWRGIEVLPSPIRDRKKLGQLGQIVEVRYSQQHADLRDWVRTGSRLGQTSNETGTNPLHALILPSSPLWRDAKERTPLWRRTTVGLIELTN